MEEDIIQRFLKEKDFSVEGNWWELKEAIENLIQRNKELEEYKKYAELTKISCCTAQNCEALNNAIRSSLENENLIKRNKELEESNHNLLLIVENSTLKSKVREKIEE